MLSTLSGAVKAGVTFAGTPALSIAESERNIKLDIAATRINAAARANELGFAGLNQRVKGYAMRTNATAGVGNSILKMGYNFVKSNNFFKSTPTETPSTGTNSVDWVNSVMDRR
jgi:hypothetical protein